MRMSVYSDRTVSLLGRRGGFVACCAGLLAALCSPLAAQTAGDEEAVGPPQPDAAAQAPGQEPAKSGSPATARTHPNSPELWNAEQMMEDAVLQITRRYNLNPAQENFTRLLLKKRTLEFLDQYEGEVRELLKESIDLRLGFVTAGPGVYRQWAERAVPIYEAAKDAILGGNEEWGVILNEEQKKLHDQDLNLMRQNFARVSQTLVAWKEGGGPRGPWGAPTQRTRQASKTTGRVSDRPSIAENRLIEENWLAYVNKFIQVYKLDEKQKISARERILKGSLDRAKAYRKRHKDDFKRIEAKLKELKTDSKKAKLRRELLQKKDELDRPIRLMFIAMDKRLKALPDDKQLARADAQAKKELGALFKRLAGELPVKRKTGGSVRTRPDAKKTGADAASKPADKAKPQEEKEKEKEKEKVAPAPVKGVPPKDGSRAKPSGASGAGDTKGRSAA